MMTEKTYSVEVYSYHAGYSVGVNDDPFWEAEEETNEHDSITLVREYGSDLDTSGNLVAVFFRGLRYKLIRDSGMDK